MKFLVDTHAFLWFALNDSRLSSNARSLMVDRESQLLISPATLWEIAIKISLGKYSLTGDYQEFVEQQIADNDLTLLPITPRHASIVATLPYYHRDPFDRLLVAQAIAEQLPLLSGDAVLDKYPIARIW